MWLWWAGFKRFGWINTHPAWNPLLTPPSVVTPPYCQRFGSGVALVEVPGGPLAAMTV